MQKQIILFDLDGTLTDPFEGISKSVQHALLHFGITENDTDKLRRFIGPPLRENFSKSYGLNADDCETAVKVFRERFSTIGIYENKLYDDIPDLLDYLTKNGHTLAIASSKAEIFVGVILEYFKIRQYFSFVGGSEYDGGRSDKAEIIQYVLSSLNISNLSQAVMIGDREHDIFGARKVGVESIGILYGYGDRTELENAGADYIVKDIGELSNLLERL